MTRRLALVAAAGGLLGVQLGQLDLNPWVVVALVLIAAGIIGSLGNKLLDADALFRAIVTRWSHKINSG